MNYINIILAAIFINNILLIEYLGINATIASSNGMGNAFSIGMATTIITSIIAVISKLVYDSFLANYSNSSLNLFVFVLIVALVIHVYNAILRKTSNESFHSLSRFMPSVVANGLTLGIAILINNIKSTLLETLVYAISVSIGFNLTLIIVTAINDKYKNSTVERQFREKALTIISLGLIALAFYGFKGFA